MDTLDKLLLEEGPSQTSFERKWKKTYCNLKARDVIARAME
jgi:hypothetical protein